MIVPWLKTLDEIEGSDLPLVGSKAFNLATLRRHGLPVSPGLVVTTAFFEAHLRHLQLIPLWAGSPDVAVTEGALYWLGDTLKTSHLSPELAAALQAELAAALPGVESFAVRSSAIDEDSYLYAFSGVHLSELSVPREMIPISLARCWASALSQPALEYRRRHGVSIQSIRMAVLIQPFVQPAAAGVAFTLNPLSGTRDEVVVEAVFGHGQRVAGGQVTPTRYRLAKRPPEYLLLGWTPGQSAPAANQDKTRRDTPPAVEGHGPLSASQLRRLAHYLEQIEALMAAPQDVEWAIARGDWEEDGKFVFFQTRPITAWPGESISSHVEWTRANYREFLPDLPSPMCISLLERIQDQALSFFDRLGFSTREAGPYLRVIYGRPYLNLTLARHLMAQSGLNADGKLWIIGHTELPGKRDGPRTVDWSQMWQARRPVARTLLHGLRLGGAFKRFERVVGDVRQSLQATDWSQPSPPDLLARFRLRAQVSSHMAEVNFLISVVAVTAFSATIQLLGSLTGQVREAIRETIDRDVQAREARQAAALLDLAAVAQADERARGYLSRVPHTFEDYRQALADTPFLAAFDRFVAEYGEHAAFEADPGWPRYREDPPSLLATIALMAKADVLPDGWGKEASEAANRGAGRRGLETLRPWHRWLARLAVARLSRLGKMRAELRALYGRAMTDCRAWDLRLAQRWQRRGWLEETGDYFWLTMREVERALMAEAEAGPALPALVRARQETYQTYAATEMPYTLREADIARLVPGHGLLDTALSSVLSGWPVSPGQVQGRVLVLRRPEEASHMQEGVILVTPSTDAAWFAIFPQARGLIVETGGLLSHGSIIAREFGLPAVANIPEATTRFHDGDLVLLDGSTGLVQILDSVQDTPA